MNTGNIAYINLEELSRADYKIIDGEADITGWPVIDESGSNIGKVRDLLFDPEQNAIRYIIVDLDEVIAPEEKAVLLPIGFANLGADKKEVIIPVLHESQYVALPQYIIGEITRETEMKIRSAIGSPAALRIEEEIAEMDPSEFYNHHHFDRGRLGFTRTDSPSVEHSEEFTTNDREEERNTIHELINHSAHHENAHQVDHQFEPFEINTGNDTFTIEPQENGTYRILSGGEKIGVVYAEPGERGVQWRTMDQLDDRFVEVIGENIKLHHSSISNL